MLTTIKNIRTGWIIAVSFAICLLSCCPAKAQEDTAFNSLYQRYFRLYGSQDAEGFYKASQQMKDYYLQKGKTDSYYKIRLNEVLYEAEHGQTYTAIKKSDEILEEMEQKNQKQYHIVYTAMGTIYESRGNYRMANHYYEQAINDIAPADTGSLMSIYSRLASLKMVREADKAWEWNEKFGALCKHFPDYYKVYLALKGGISFFREDRRMFLKTYDEFQQFIKEHADLDEYGVETMNIGLAAFNGQYDEALELLKTTNQDFDALKNFDFRIKIYEMMGNEHLAITEANKRRDYRDSLNSDMFYNNISQVNAELNVAKINQQAAEERELWMVIVILLLLGIIAVSMAWSIWYRRINQQLKKQNQDLESALDRAEESDRMKSAFIEQVSHEIRTPLNVITGFAQIITNPSYQLNEKERDEMLNAISKNTHEITNIVNELLEVAQDESRNQYDKEDNIVCEELCNQVMDEAHRQNNGRLELQYVNEVPKGFTFKSNRKVMEKILNQLMDNAMKFTEKGSVELRSAYNAPLHTLAFIITDTGIGIPKEEHPNIFHRFFKVDQFKQGLGLGLTMCKKMADLLGYQLYIDSNYTAGCKMVLKFEV